MNLNRIQKTKNKTRWLYYFMWIFIWADKKIHILTKNSKGHFTIRRIVQGMEIGRDRR